ncbi:MULTISPECIES: hypothetical protein [Erythrobacter]|uniref:Uncharacterized protein n=1 Tax=Erythrobacter aureus TaxID=2182384 RepID=A0A345YGW0_9SPHN|nr:MULTISPECIES: hypothetical protein [Erythrobacter]AXK43162.1 hypothetical protein DVR09_13285 [Erythrobacter aureus]MBL43613.1 hypothetical protein [Sphingomonadaceae bacterium]MCF8883916.1 hypothetical protein [Erythrobacter sp. SN021]|tara:strand:+ start:5479 stop:5751 length:273 start_codon:yes stop_codon:yes gene_type:complete
MSGWVIVAIIAILVWGVTQWNRARHGIVTDEYGNESRAASDDAETRREIEELRERIKVLERIATDSNSLDARKTKRIAAEIEALRDKQAD